MKTQTKAQSQLNFISGLGQCFCGASSWNTWTSRQQTLIWSWDESSRLKPVLLHRLSFYLGSVQTLTRVQLERVDWCTSAEHAGFIFCWNYLLWKNSPNWRDALKTSAASISREQRWWKSRCSVNKPPSRCIQHLSNYTPTTTHNWSIPVIWILLKLKRALLHPESCNLWNDLLQPCTTNAVASFKLGLQHQQL